MLRHHIPVLKILQRIQTFNISLIPVLSRRVPSLVECCHHFPSRSITTSPALSNGFATDAVPAADNNNIFKKMMKKFGWADNSRARLRVSSYMLYRSVADQINYMEFFGHFNMPNTFNSWFLVTELHVWMLLLRAMAEGDESGADGRFMRNCIVEAMWADVNHRAKKLGSQNPSSVRSQIQTLSQQFQAALIAYDEGITSDDRTLAAALWRRFFVMDCDNYAQLEDMVLYVRRHVRNLDMMNRQNFVVKPKMEWISIKNVDV